MSLVEDCKVKDNSKLVTKKSKMCHSFPSAVDHFLLSLDELSPPPPPPPPAAVAAGGLDERLDLFVAVVLRDASTALINHYYLSVYVEKLIVGLKGT